MNKKNKKIVVFSVLLILLFPMLSACGGGSGESNLTFVEKEEIRMDVRDYLNYLGRSEATAEQEIDKLQNNLSSNAKITYIDQDGYVYEFTKNEYIELTALSYAAGYEVISSKIGEPLIVVNSRTKVNASFMATETITNGRETITETAAFTADLIRNNNSWIVVNYRIIIQ